MIGHSRSISLRRDGKYLTAGNAIMVKRLSEHSTTTGRRRSGGVRKLQGQVQRWRSGFSLDRIQRALQVAQTEPNLNGSTALCREASLTNSGEGRWRLHGEFSALRHGCAGGRSYHCRGRGGVN